MGGAIDTSRFREKFVREAKERLERMNGFLLRLEKSPDDTWVGEGLLREAHTLKGAARMMGLSRVSELAHQFEEALGRRLSGRAVASQDLADALFLSLDALGRLVEAVAAGNPDGFDAAEAVRRLRSAQVAPEEERKGDPARTASAASAPASHEPFSPPALGADAGRGIPVDPERLEHLSNLATAAFGRHIRQVQMRERIGDLGVRYRRVAAEIAAVLRDAVARGAIPQDLAARIGPLLDEGRSAFMEIGSRIADLRHRESEEANALGHALDDLRSGLFAVRMIPLAPVLESYRRPVRDLARELGKDVEYLVRGGKTEIDRNVAEALAEPLVHLVRNALDHGIEPPDVRVERGKPPRGRIAVTATPKKGRVVIEVEDDGAGIDLQEVRDAAVRRGFIAERAAYRLDERGTLAFVFQPGFSTARTTSEISGRGIGMDVVRRVAERFNGTCDVASVAGKGTRVVLELPYTTAISRVLVFRAGGQCFGLPMLYAEQVLRFSDRDVTVVEGSRTLTVDGAPVPFVRLGRFLGLGRSRGRRRERTAVIVNHSQNRVALAVERVEGESEVIVRDLGRYVEKVPLFVGSTVTGAGEVALLLDAFDLLAAIRLQRPDGEGERTGDAVETPEVLVVDDSLLGREMQRRVLSGAGYRVETAPGAREALDLLGRREFDVVLAGARMSGMDGFDLAARMAGDERYREIPVVLVVAGEATAERDRALASGARACVARPEFRAERIVPLIERLVGEGAA